ncbi:FAD-dependent monooxygenase [Kibdelosporangium lantanae]
MNVPQAAVERALEDRLAQLGVRVARGHELTGITRHDTHVTVVAGERRIRASYLVGCDGGRSTVRKLTGVAFPGTDATRFAFVADVVLARIPATMPTRLRSVRDAIVTAKDGTRGAGGLIPLGEPGHFRVAFDDPDNRSTDREAPVPAAEVTAAMRRVYGNEVEIAEVRWASRFTNATRQAERYRTGRVLLAGDAAHIHYPAGGQGLNLGVQDAMNLGWKLAAEVRGHAPAGLLDTYHTERHPVGARALDATRAQTLPPHPSPETLALHRLLTELAELPDTNQYLAGMTSGLDIRYPLEGPDHPLLGTRLPDTRLTINGHPEWASTLFHPGRAVLLSTHPIPTAWSGRVAAVVVPEPPAPDTQAVLVRPDGYICWVATTSDTEGLEAALRTWVGA